MNQHLDLMAAQSMAREREHDLRSTLRTREAISRRVRADAVHAPDAAPGPAVGHHWLHDLLVRVHLAHAPIH